MYLIEQSTKIACRGCVRGNLAWMEGIWGALLSAFVGAVPVGICSRCGLPEVWVEGRHAC